MARKGEAPLAQIAKDFGLSVTTLKRWVAIAERKEAGAGPAAAESAETRELKKRNRLLEQENEILRRAAAYLAREPHEEPLLWVSDAVAWCHQKGGDWIRKAATLVQDIINCES